MESGKIVFVGGGTCAGKTTAARRVAEDAAVRVFSVDDRLEGYARIAEAEGNIAMREALSSDFERLWMRDPGVQLDEMLRFYADAFPYAMDDLREFAASVNRRLPGGAEPSFAPVIVAEGIAFMPELLHAAGVAADRCVFATCPRALHDERYARRDWMPLMLDGCSDPERAFELWMDRDELFAEHVRSECARLGYPHILVDSDNPGALADAIGRLVAGAR